jgi:hypothetical protein
MTHNSALTTFFQFEVIISLALIFLLFVIAISKKKMLVSETAITRIKTNWSEFKTTFYFGVIGMVFFLLLISLELLEIEQHAVFHTKYPVLVEWLQILMVGAVIIVNGLSIHLIRKLTGSEV